ncbi:unnamed protein product [Trifolium pratense]|uniref:Uncharacterized protein n=1 Tax=Trifolium pratense TaxID=57577 RepID=A0ACB0J3G7_TRIPR|nr:unnamed protein product [Trifolium pratense]
MNLRAFKPSSKMQTEGQRIKQLREVSFHIEDVVDEYLRLIHRTDPSGCGSLVCKIPSLIKTLTPRHNIASEIQDIKLSIRGIKERSERYNFQISHTPVSSSSTGETENGRWRDPRLSALFIEETEIVGFEDPREELIGWLLEGAADRNISILHCERVIDKHKQFCRETQDPLPQMLHKMDDKSLIIEVRQYLQNKRYLIFFDDVWQEDFSDQVEFSMPNNNKGSRIIITTRMMHVAEFFKKSCLVHVHKLQLLPPKEIEAESKEIVKKFKQLPLAIVSIGGLLSTKSKTMIEWQKTPEDYAINHNRLIRQWIAEGFIKSEDRRYPEQVAEEESIAVGKTRRLSVITSPNNVFKSAHNSHFRAIHVFEKGGSLEYFMHKLCSRSRILKVLDIQGIRNTKVQPLPKSVGELHNLETLDLRETLVHEIPSEINKRTKLRHFLDFHRNYEEKYSILGFTTGVLMEKGIKNLTSLQDICYVEVDHGGVELIEEMKMLKQLKKLGLRRVKREHGKALSAAIIEMLHLESLNITAIAEDEIIDLNFVSSLPKLRRLHLKARLEKFPDWLPKLECLVKIRLGLSMLKDDPLQSLCGTSPTMVKFCILKMEDFKN